MNDPGGGASRSTDPAFGSSSATDVSLREYLGEKIAALDRHLTGSLDALRRETVLANENAEKAIVVAADESKERLKAHNGLIEQMQQQAAHFATRESLDDFKEANDKRIARLERFQAMLVGGMLLVSLVGVANLIKVWTS